MKLEGGLTENIVVTDEELKSLTDAIHQRHGIDFSCYEPKSLKRRVVRALHIFKLNAVHELWIKILRDRSFIYPFMDEISVGLTSMFRDPILWKRLKYILNLKLIDQPDLSIWHAGCSTAEEVYTMGVVLRESTFDKPVKGWATDISNQAMETGKKGIYSSLKMAEYDRNYLQYNPAGTLKKYYQDDGTNVSLDKSLITHITFEHHNLITDPIRRKFDIIFCRNVMIYFDDKAKRMIFDKFHESLNPGGLLVIGFYDAVLPLVEATKFKVLDLDAKIFERI